MRLAGPGPDSAIHYKDSQSDELDGSENVPTDNVLNLGSVCLISSELHFFAHEISSLGQEPIKDAL